MSGDWKCELSCRLNSHIYIVTILITRIYMEEFAKPYNTVQASTYTYPCYQYMSTEHRRPMRRSWARLPLLPEKTMSQAELKSTTKNTYLFGFLRGMLVRSAVWTLRIRATVAQAPAHRRIRISAGQRLSVG
jgi:hypothetical protein